MSKDYKNKEWLINQYTTLKKSTVQIGKECNVNYGTIIYWLRRFSIKIRTHSEANKISHNRPETKKKMSESQKKRKSSWWLGKHHSKETKKKISEARKGNISEANKGKYGKESSNWKGKMAKEISKYHRIHEIIKRVKPKPNKCENCGKKTTKLHLSFNHFHKAGNPIYYTKNPNDYTYRCVKCHRKYDKKLTPNQSITLKKFLLS